MNSEALEKCTTWKLAGPVEKAAFLRHMQGRRYGWEETLDAWYWFHAGYTGTLEARSPE